MNAFDPEDLSGVPMLNLFRVEAETQLGALTSGLLQLEREPANRECLATLMRAAHSLKGAARIIGHAPIEQLAHAMEDCFEAPGKVGSALERQAIDLLLRAVDVLGQFLRARGNGAEFESSGSLLELLKGLNRFADGASPKPGAAQGSTAVPPGPAAAVATQENQRREGALRRPEQGERVLRLAAENLNRLLGLAGESLVESRWLKTFSDSLQELKRYHTEASEKLTGLRQIAAEPGTPDRIAAGVNQSLGQIAAAQQFLADRLQDLETYDRRFAHLSQRMYLEVLRTRMRPFSEGVRRFPRMVRDLARTLHKEVRIEITGEATQVDRDILERLETPLGHLIRNALDHGCELPETRVQRGKAAEAVVSIEARHSAGALIVNVRDDGAGVNLAELRQTLVRKGLVPADHAEKLGESELLEALFIPGFTLKETVTEISGRGYGLDIVQNMVRQVRGAIRLFNEPGRGFRVQLQLPLTLSVLRALLVEIAGEPYALPLNQISRTIKLESSSIYRLDGAHYCQYGGQELGLVSGRQLLEPGESLSLNGETCVVILGERGASHALAVDRFIGERELVVQALDPAIGRVRNVNAAALLDDGSPVLIFDVDELLQSMGRIRRRETPAAGHAATPAGPRQKSILVVDDSATVRRLEQQLLTTRGYRVDTATDGQEAWDLLRAGAYDLVLTDIEMPRLDGIQLASLVKKEPSLKSTAVLIISYRDREEDRLRGLAAGADGFLTKTSFDEQQLLRAISGLIGEPGA